MLITTADNLLSSLFWSGYLKYRKVLITKVILLPERDEVDFPLWFKPLAFLKIFGLSGIIKMLFFRMFTTKVSVFDACQSVSFLNCLDQAKLLRELNQSRVDVLISVGAPIILKTDILSIATRHCLNLHNGDICKFRGHFSTFWEVATSEKKVCVTLHEMEDRVDSGAIYQQICEERSSFRNFQEVMFWKKQTGGAMLAKALNALDDVGYLKCRIEINAETQEAKYYPFPSVSDVLNFSY